jgi:hypothetical protein
MKAYKKELSHFFSHKKEQDEQLKKALARKTFEEKQSIIKEFRESTTLDNGVYSINEEYAFERKPFIRDIYYLEKLNEDIVKKHLQFNKYKYDTLYELVEFDETTYDTIEGEIIELKRKRDEYISKRGNKMDEDKAFNDKINFNVNELIEEFKQAELADQKNIYRQIIDLKISKFDKLEPHLSMVRIGNYKTLVTDYLPIKRHERNLLDLSISPENVVLTPEVLEPEQTNESNESESFESNSSRSNRSSISKNEE